MWKIIGGTFSVWMAVNRQWYQWVISSLVDDSTVRQPGFDLPGCYWALLNHFWTKQGHCASCCKKWVIAATDVSLWQCQTMSHVVNSCPQSKLEGAAAIALSWWRCYWMAEDIRLINALDNNDNHECCFPCFMCTAVTGSTARDGHNPPDISHRYC